MHSMSHTSLPITRYSINPVCARLALTWPRARSLLPGAICGSFGFKCSSGPCFRVAYPHLFINCTRSIASYEIINAQNSKIYNMYIYRLRYIKYFVYQLRVISYWNFFRNPNRLKQLNYKLNTQILTMYIYTHR